LKILAGEAAWDNQTPALAARQVLVFFYKIFGMFSPKIPF